MAVTTPTASLAEFCATLRLEDIPDKTRERVKDILLDALASAYAGHDSNEADKLLAFVRSVAPTGTSTVIGGGALSLGAAALLNGYLITAVTVCDIHRPTHCHVTPEVVAPALAASEALASSGCELLVALALGLEVTTRVGLALKPELFRGRGWHAPGVTGPFGGAAAVGRLRGLDSSRLSNAFGLAGSQAAGSYAQLRTPGIKFQQGRGALSGLMSGWLAATGFAAAQEILIHPDGGLLNTHSDGGDPRAVTDQLGQRWELEEISLRAWPVAVQLQPLVTSLLDLVVTNNLQPEHITEVRVDVSDVAYQLHGAVDWSDRFRARLSVHYVTGAVICDRRCWLDQFSSARVADPDLGAFIRNHVSVTHDPSLPEGTVRVTITTRDGEVYQDRRVVAKGEPRDPLTREEIKEKFFAASRSRLDDAAAQAVVDLVSGLEGVSDVRVLTGHLRSDSWT